MSIRIGSSCAITKSMAIGKVIETRRYLNVEVDWVGVSKQAIQTKQYLIVTICINHNNSQYTYPNDDQWRTAVDDTCRKLKSWGGNRNNCRISLINEPMKYITREQYAHFINLAYPIINSHGFLCGAGNEEFLTAQAKGDMYPHILYNCMFDILDIHIQGSCNTPAKTKYWTNVAIQWATQYGRQIDCTEAFYANIATASGWTLLQSQLHHAERIGCPNFCNVFNNLVRSAFPTLDTTRWDKLCFKIDGILRSNYWATYKILMDTKGPMPNIISIEEDDDMKLVNLKPGLSGGQVKWLQEILMIEYGYPNDYEDPFDGKYGNVTRDQVKLYQAANNLTQDGVVGIDTTLDMLFDVDEKPATDRVKSTDYWDKRLKIMVAFWAVK